MKVRQRWTDEQTSLAKKLFSIRAPDEDFRRLLKRTRASAKSHLARLMSEKVRSRLAQERKAIVEKKRAGKVSRLGIVATLKRQSDEYGQRPIPTIAELRWVGWRPETPNQYWLGDPPYQRSALYATIVQTEAS